jgi:hypothetical protein
MIIKVLLKVKRLQDIFLEHIEDHILVNHKMVYDDTYFEWI